jgi:hypothetical protein
MTDDMPDGMEEQLRAALRERAKVPAAAGDPVAAVQARMQQRTRRHRGIAAAATAALCVAGIAIAATALAGNDTASRPAGPAASSSNPAVSPSEPAFCLGNHAINLACARTPLPSAPTSPASSPSPSAPIASVVAPSSSAPPALPPNASPLTLPTGDTFYGLSTESGQLLLTGTVTSTDQNAPCVRTTVDAAALTLGAVTTGRCDDPASSGDRVSYVVNNPDGGSPAFTSSIAITVTDPNTGVLTTGPIVMRFSEASDTRPVAAYGGGSLWIYDVDTSNGPEAIQVSATSGKVEDVVRTPQFYRPIMTANNDGLWLGNSIEGGQLPGTLYHVAPASHLVTTVSSSSDNEIVDWMLADNGHVWAGVRPAGGSLLSLRRLDGPTGKVALDLPEPSLEVGFNYVVGNEQDGLWLTTPDPPFGATAAPTDNQHLDVVRLDPNTGKPTVEAALPPVDQLIAESGTTPETAAFFAGDYFLLRSPFLGGYSDFTQLLRVTPLP